MATERLPEVEAFLARQPLAAVIGGEDVASANGEIFTTLDPGTGQVLAHVYAAQPQDVERAVQAATNAFARAPWARLPVNQRATLLHRLADAVEQRKPIIAQIESLDCGKLVGQAEGDVQNFVDTMRYFVDMSPARAAAQRAGRRQARGLDRPAAVGARAASSSPGTFPSCWSAGASRPHWPPATPSSSSRPKTRRSRPSTWRVWPRKSAFPTV